MTNRDDFTKPTIDALAKRVGYVCSNPSCKKHTSGPNDNESKFTLIGVAAHIAAAAPGGPRYDAEMSPEERRHISNGIWLCSNCSTLIDKDEKTYPAELLKVWKYQAELDMRNALSSQAQTNNNRNQQNIPILEADLIWHSSMRANHGYSQKNTERYGDGPIMAGSPLIVFWEISWRLSFMVHNNSSFPAYNVSIEPEGDVKFSSITKLPKINNLPAYSNLDLEAQTRVNLEGDHIEADALMAHKIPIHLNGLKLKISYKDEARNEHEVLVTIQDGEVINQKMK